MQKENANMRICAQHTHSVFQVGHSLAINIHRRCNLFNCMYEKIYYWWREA